MSWRNSKTGRMEGESGSNRRRIDEGRDGGTCCHINNFTAMGSKREGGW